MLHGTKRQATMEANIITMPSRKAADGEYRDIAHPINSDTRERIQTLILQKYQETMAAEE